MKAKLLVILFVKLEDINILSALSVKKHLPTKMYFLPSLKKMKAFIA